MNKRHGYATLAALMAVVALICCAIYLGVGATKARTAARTSVAPAPVWVGTWSAAPVMAAPAGPADPIGRIDAAGPAGRSVRNVVHTSIGGSAARITLSNVLGAKPLTIARVSLAVRADNGPAAVPGTLRRITFRGAPGATITAGGQLVSDPVVLRVPDDGDLLVTVHTPAPGGPLTFHPHARQTSYLADGDRTQDVLGTAYTRLTPSWYHLTGIDVLTPEARGTIVAIGDSITDGVSSTPDTNSRWPDVLADRLSGRYGVLNQGISGNRLLMYGRGPSTLDRFERDVLDQSGARTVIVAIGINDLLRAPYEPTADRVTAGLAELTRRAHARGLRVVGATLLPCGGHALCTPAVEAARTKVNTAVRTGRIFDAVVDFDRALRDPYAPHRMRAVYDSGDHLHPSDIGYRRMGRAVDPARL
ncbi:SGNH/GDSL hydrolase family protein [Streptomyces sp. NBC_01142]|uniref:SGNH/GDSL hydrolase family protein n=1 Tax=Streptomyces sp. NBC_01142 TaxID=2975865 RepID=UPI002254B1D2|nr:SGNH/GDSL hydrolase family protein [Streptomyces sp. NBC_01142]MCX4823371.1 SGNH/GDSL hydrolase family protein [Streptomyces sp. NBC_01142]